MPGHSWSCLKGRIHMHLIKWHHKGNWPSLGSRGVMHSSAGARPWCVSEDYWNRPLATNKLFLCPPSCFTELQKQHSQSTHSKFKKRERRNQSVTEQQQGCYFCQNSLSLPDTVPHSCCSSSEHSASSLHSAALEPEEPAQIQLVLLLLLKIPALLGLPVVKASPAYQ